jgi:toxin ParE1/3/4
VARIRISAEAKVDLLEIWLFIAQDSVESAERVNSSIRDKLRILATQPEIGRRRDELKNGMRSLATGNYQIYYESMRGGIRVLRVLHAARDVGRVFN